MPAGSSPFAPKAPLERLLFASPSVGVGTFRCDPEHPQFADSGPSSTYCFVFPRTSVWIQHADGRPFVADPGVVTYYNAGQAYTRRKLSPEGDRADWFAVAPEIAEEVVASVTPRAPRTSHAVFTFTHGPSDAVTYLAQRQLCERLEAAHPVEGLEPLEIEEQVVGFLAALAPRAAEREASRGPGESALRRGQLADDARAALAGSLSENVHLADIARRVGASVFHLCRVFKEFQGSTLHAYRLDLRLRLALERLDGGGGDLTTIAMELGFSSHSHFTAAFKRQFGRTPSAYMAEQKNGSGT
jgi:AraC-like DNA-binding protein